MKKYTALLVSSLAVLAVSTGVSHAVIDLTVFDSEMADLTTKVAAAGLTMIGVIIAGMAPKWFLGFLIK